MTWLYWIISNPALNLYILAALLVGIRLWGRGQAQNRALAADITLAYFLLLVVGFNGLYNFFMHAFFGDMIAAYIGWAQSPFQFEVAMANLALGVLGILAFRANFGFRLATVIATSVFMLGAAGGHIYNLVVTQNIMPGNIGTVLFTDILIPVTLIFLLWRNHTLSRGHALGADRYIDQ
jgi:hypothetical protein